MLTRMWSNVAELPESHLDLGECRVSRSQVEVPTEVDHAEALPADVLDHAGTVTGLAAQEVGRAHDPRLGVEIRIDLTAVVGMVAERDRVDPRGQQLIGGLGCDAQPARDVLAVDDHERGGVAFPEDR